MNVKDIDGSTSLLDAYTNGHHEIVKLLIENKADMNVKDKEGNTILISAAY